MSLGAHCNPPRASPDPLIGVSWSWVNRDQVAVRSELPLDLHYPFASTLLRLVQVDIPLVLRSLPSALQVVATGAVVAIMSGHFADAIMLDVLCRNVAARDINLPVDMTTLGGLVLVFLLPVTGVWANMLHLLGDHLCKRQGRG